MTVFISLLNQADKSPKLLELAGMVRINKQHPYLYYVNSKDFSKLPGSPFSYWASNHVREIFAKCINLENSKYAIKQGLATADDFRFLRLYWEVKYITPWADMAKGGAFSRYYSDIYLKARWDNNGYQISNNLNSSGGVRSNIWMLKETVNTYFKKAGLTWSLRSQRGFSVRALPNGSIFGHKGPVVFIKTYDDKSILSHMAILNSQYFNMLLALRMAFGSYEVGVIQRTPIPDLTSESTEQLAALARRAYYLKRTLDTINETSHAFILPEALRSRASAYDPAKIEQELADIQQEIDDLVFDLYGFDEADRAAIQTPDSSASEEEAAPDDEGDEEEEETGPDTQTGLLSWAVGVAFGRFDWRLATQERDMPADPEPFDPLPAKSPGMLPDGATPFHTHQGILTDDTGHPHDLTRLVESVLEKVNVSVPANVQQWLRRDFFAEHLKQYSKSRRKAPIYWPLSTPSGSYTLWVYYPALTNQTLYSAVNDFLEPKLKQVQSEIATLREKGSGRSKDEEKKYEGLLSLEQELLEFRNVLLEIAPTYQPNHDDGVQITAAPLWQLFRHKPWQKLLKDTWAKLQKGDYDWAYLAMAYWPDRVREKCKMDKSLAIAHDLEDLYEEPIAAPKKGKKAGGSK